MKYGMAAVSSMSVMVVRPRRAMTQLARISGISCVTSASSERKEY